jgi:hypothetical protein
MKWCSKCPSRPLEAVNFYYEYKTPKKPWSVPTAATKENNGQNSAEEVFSLPAGDAAAQSPGSEGQEGEITNPGTDAASSDAAKPAFPNFPTEVQEAAPNNPEIFI